jgi:hypothetical protein
MLPFVKFLHFQNRVSKRHKKYQIVSKSNLTVQFIQGARPEGLAKSAAEPNLGLDPWFYSLTVCTGTAERGTDFPRGAGPECWTAKGRRMTPAAGGNSRGNRSSEIIDQ